MGRVQCNRRLTKWKVKSSMAFRAQGRHFSFAECHSLSKNISASVDGKCQSLKHVSKATQPDSRVPKSLTLLPYTMLVPNSAVTMPGKVTTYEEPRHSGTAQPQPSPVSPIYIRRAKLQQLACLMEPYEKSLYLYACSIKNCTHLQSETSHSVVLHQDIQHKLLCVCSALQEQPIGLMSNQGQDSTLNICTETPNDIWAETMEKGPVI